MPIVTMDYIELSEYLLSTLKALKESITHLVHLENYVSQVFYGNPMIMDPIDYIIDIEVTATGKDMYLVASFHQCFGQLRHMRCYSTDFY